MLLQAWWPAASNKQHREPKTLETFLGVHAYINNLEIDVNLKPQTNAFPAHYLLSIVPSRTVVFVRSTDT